jgi:putative RNA 2'-phosphotransferase
VDDLRLSKTLSLLLRHRPQAFGLRLDEAGWVDVSSLLAALSVTREQLERVVRESDKQRFALDSTRTRIRAHQGHSTKVELGYPTCAPPAQLYHGTVDRYLDAIRREGLQKQARHHVHLSADEQTANAVGARRGRAVVLIVDAGSMHADGHLFYRADNDVWLTASVPSAYLGFPTR